MEGEDQRKSQRLAKCKHTKRRRRRREKRPWRRKRRERRQLIRTLRGSKIGFLQMQDNLQQQGGNKQRKKGWHWLQIWWGWDSWAPWTVLRLLSGSFLTARKADSVRAPIVTGTWRLIISAIWSADLLRWKAKTLGAPCTLYSVQCTTLGPLSRLSVIHRESHRQASWFGSIPIGLYQLGEHESCFCNSSLWNIITVWHLRMAWSADLARLRLGPLGLPLLVERGIVQACSNSQLTFPIRIEINWC